MILIQVDAILHEQVMVGRVKEDAQLVCRAAIQDLDHTIVDSWVERVRSTLKRYEVDASKLRQTVGRSQQCHLKGSYEN